MRRTLISLMLTMAVTAMAYGQEATADSSGAAD